jgi:hypothetical protein
MTVLGARRKLQEWAVRYLPAEIVGTVTAVAAAWTVHAASGSLVSAAVAGTVGESLGYYGCMVLREALRHDARHRHHGAPMRLWLTGTGTVRDMLIEFGPAELVDSLLVRPLCMYLIPSLLNDFTAGILAGKLAADVVFYSLAIGAYELKRRYLPASVAVHGRLPAHPPVREEIGGFPPRAALSGRHTK